MSAAVFQPAVAGRLAPAATVTACGVGNTVNNVNTAAEAVLTTAAEAVAWRERLHDRVPAGMAQIGANLCDEDREVRRFAYICWIICMARTNGSLG